MAYVVVQGLCKVFQYGTCGNLTVAQMVNTESLQVAYLEMAGKLLAGKVIGKDPVVKLTQAVSGSERLAELLATATLYEHLLGRTVCLYDRPGPLQ